MADAQRSSDTAPAAINTVPDTGDSQSGSPLEQLADFTARATALYAVKKYEEAAELYSQATELQAEINGEMSEKNADLLYYYGRCLFHLAQKTSTVLGGTAASAQLKASDKKPSKKRRANGTPKQIANTSAAGPSSSEKVIETTQPADVVPTDDVRPKSSTSDKPFFQIEGDAPDWDDSGEEEADEEDDEAEEEEEDDFNTAYEILDLARILFSRKLDSDQSHTSEEQRAVNTKLADVFDLQAEINLEGERFTETVSDMRSCLDIKQRLYEPDNALLAECYYKLSLALEAACQIQSRDKDGNPVGEVSIDWDLRNEAATQQANAIESCQLRISKERKALDAMSADKNKEKQKTKEEIDDVEDMVQAMEQRLEELKKPPVSVKAETERDAQQELMGSVLGKMLGAGTVDKEEQKARMAEVMASANDLSGMVKRKKATAPTSVNGASLSHESKLEIRSPVKETGKRKLDDVDADKPPNGNSEKVKKVRIEDVID